MIPLIELLKELGKVIPIRGSDPILHCILFEDNKGCIDLVKAPRMRPRTKHIALKYHHFRRHVKDKIISIEYVDTKEQIADIFTKALGDDQFNGLRRKFMM